MLSHLILLIKLDPVQQNSMHFTCSLGFSLNTSRAYKNTLSGRVFSESNINKLHNLIHTQITGPAPSKKGCAPIVSARMLVQGSGIFLCVQTTSKARQDTPASSCSAFPLLCWLMPAFPKEVNTILFVNDLYIFRAKTCLLPYIHTHMYTNTHVHTHTNIYGIFSVKSNTNYSFEGLEGSQ